MITSLFFSALMPWLVVMLLVQKKIQKNCFFTSPVFPFIFVGLVVAGLLFCPVGGFPLIYWSSSLMSCFSLPLMGLLLILIIEQLFCCTFFSADDWKVAWIFGAAGSLVLYPAALGLGPIDPYAWGWGSGSFFILMASFTLVLLVARNRFAILLLIAIAAFDIKLQESTNLWDYLIDPIYAIVALMMSMRYLFFKEKRKELPSHLFVR